MHIRAGTEPDPEPMVDINTTPLVDVLLVLLVMLIITIPIQLNAVSLEMPGRSAPTPPVEPVIVQLQVDAAVGVERVAGGEFPVQRPLPDTDGGDDLGRRA